MGIFDYMVEHGHEQLVFCYDKASGLKAIIGIHDTTLGPALGGCRIWPYHNENEAIYDVIRLSKGMTYKSSAMGNNLGGGKAVILADPRTEKSEALLRAFGRFVETQGGRYITAEDVGTTVEDLGVIGYETDYYCGREEVSGDPSPATAFGVYQGLKAAAKVAFGSESLAGKRVAIQGVGKVGRDLVRRLIEEGAQVVVTDISEASVQQVVEAHGVEAVAPEEIYDVDCDIFAPCALGAVINDDTISRLKCKVVAGSANNQLEDPRHGEALRQRGILYAPDYVINGGGVINVAEEYHPGGYDRERAYRRIATIYDKLLHIFAVAEAEAITPGEAADRIALRRIEAIGQVHRTYLPE